jgi:glycosyltransferase involved in cell wall biosynthesis
MTAARPHISVILATRDRPRFLPLALACYQHQTWPDTERELIVVDDGDQHPVMDAAVEAVHGRLLRVPPGTPLGSKMNVGIAAARGRFIQKMDDDDWYAPAFLVEMQATLADAWQDSCRPTLLFLSPFLFFDLAAWELRRSMPNRLPGATLHFPRTLWEEQPFRPLFGDEDTWFLLDQQRRGAVRLTCAARDSFLAVRHTAVAAERGHTWTHQMSGSRLEDYTSNLERDSRAPEDLLPPSAVAAYQQIRAGVTAGAQFPKR